ncbi:MAG: hypothetical protein WBC22_15275 [Sedimentisphaerales bacterium]
MKMAAKQTRENKTVGRYYWRRKPTAEESCDLITKPLLYCYQTLV